MLGGMMTRTLHNWGGLGVVEKEPRPLFSPIYVDRKLKPSLKFETGRWVYREYIGAMDTFIIRAYANSVQEVQKIISKKKD